jgi:precorrin-2/cobalt-factor-2 C20-methyltransferase
MSFAKLYAVGIGPGDPELLTIKAQRVLESVDVLFIPKSSEDKRSLAYSIVNQVVKKNWECIELLLPMTRDRQALEEHWRQAAQMVLTKLAAGREAAYITLGDPGLYSTLGYLMDHLRQLAPQLEVEIIPGVSSINAISAWAQEPLARGDENLLILSALPSANQFLSAVEQFDNIIVLKAGNKPGTILDILKAGNFSGSIYLASRCGFADGFISRDLAELSGHDLDYLSTVFIRSKS